MIILNGGKFIEKVRVDRGVLGNQTGRVFGSSWRTLSAKDLDINQGWGQEGLNIFEEVWLGVICRIEWDGWRPKEK